MTNVSIQAIRNWKSSLLALFIIGFVVSFSTYSTYTHYQQRGFLSIPLLLFCVFFFIFFLLIVLQLIDRKPLIIISDRGIAMRQNSIPFSGLKQIEWTEISWYRTTINVNKGLTTHTLFIGGDALAKEYNTVISNLDVDASDILNKFRRYAVKYNIRDLNRDK